MLSTGTGRPHRLLRAPPERVYRALLDADAMTKMLPPHALGFICKVYHLDAEVGGSYRKSLTNFSTGSGHSFGETHHELVPGEKICYSDRFDDPNLPGDRQATIGLKTVSCGTELTVLQEGLLEVTPMEMRHVGWQ